MKKIRRKVFETNSSSSHSISIVECEEELYDTIYPDEKGVIFLGGQEFGWEWERYTDAETKANYCAIDCWDDVDRREMLIELLQEHTGAITIEFDDSGYIDHQSSGTSSDAFFDKQSLKDFIFNPKSILFTGNDNGEAPSNFYDPVDAVYDKKLVIEGLDDYILIYQGMSEEILTENIVRMMREHPLTSGKWNRSIGDYDHEYSFYGYNVSGIDGRDYNSLSKVSQGILVLFKVNVLRDDNGYWKGVKVLGTKEIKYDIVPNNNSK